MQVLENEPFWKNKQTKKVLCLVEALMFKHQDVKIPNNFDSKIYHTCDYILNTKEDQL